MKLALEIEKRKALYGEYYASAEDYVLTRKQNYPLLPRVTEDYPTLARQVNNDRKNDVVRGLYSSKLRQTRNQDTAHHGYNYNESYEQYPRRKYKT